MKSCFFIGHRDVYEDIFPQLFSTVEKHITEYRVTEFIVGQYGTFDQLAAKAVIKAKQLYPEIVLRLLLPYHPAERPINIPPGFDNTYYPPEMEKVPRKFAISRANRYMVTCADYLIAYAWHTASNARNLLEYASSKKIIITNIAETTIPKS